MLGIYLFAGVLDSSRHAEKAKSNLELSPGTKRTLAQALSQASCASASSSSSASQVTLDKNALDKLMAPGGIGRVLGGKAPKARLASCSPGVASLAGPRTKYFTYPIRFC